MSFSIITTVLNNEDFIIECLKSVKNQTIKKKDLEHIIIDGGSSDKTIEIIKKFKKKNKYVKLYVKKNCSIYEGLNIGIKKTKNKFIGILHSDDFYNNNDILSSVWQIFKSNKNLDLVYSNIKYAKRSNKEKIIRVFKSKKLFKNDLLKCEHPPHTSIFLKKNVFQKFGYYNENLSIASDFEFMLRIFVRHNVKSKFINIFSIIMRSGGKSTKSLKNIIISNYQVYKSFKINNLEINWIYILLKMLRKMIKIKII